MLMSVTFNDMVLTALPFTRRLVDANTPFRIRNTSALENSCEYLRMRTMFNRRLLRCTFVQGPQTAQAHQRAKLRASRVNNRGKNDDFRRTLAY